MASSMSAVEMALSRQVDGVLITPCSFESPALSTLRASRVPFVLLSRFQEGTRDDCVYCNDEEGGYQALFSTDDTEYAGFGRVDKKYVYYTEKAGDGRIGFKTYLPSRTAVVFRKKK